MKSNHSPMYKSLTVILAGCLVWASSGCQAPKAVDKAAIAPVFFPPPPNQPRLQFLTSYSGAEDFGGPKTNFLEFFLLGPPEKAIDQIVRPYGVAIHDGKIYVCDVAQKQIEVLDLENNKFSTFPLGRGVQSPVNIFIEADGTKYVADYDAGTVFVYNDKDRLVSFLGNELQIKPIDVDVRGS